jgi:hypothetical protein
MNGRNYHGKKQTADGMVNEQEAQNAQILQIPSAPPAFPSSANPPLFRGITTEQTTETTTERIVGQHTTMTHFIPPNYMAWGFQSTY